MEGITKITAVALHIAQDLVLADAKGIGKMLSSFIRIHLWRLRRLLIVYSGHLLSFLAGGLYRIGRCAAGQQYDSTQ